LEVCYQQSEKDNNKDNDIVVKYGIATWLVDSLVCGPLEDLLLLAFVEIMSLRTVRDIVFNSLF